MKDKPTSIGYVMRAFPVLYHATVLNEIKVLREMGIPVRVFSILEPDALEHRHEAAGTLPPVTYGWKNRASRVAVLKANLVILARIGPFKYWQAYQFAKRGELLGDLQAFMRLAHWANDMKQKGVTHLHAHWATEATTAALIFSWLTKLPFSFTAHAYDIYRSPQHFELKLKEASFVVTVSKYNREYITDHFGPDQGDKVHVIYPLIDLSKFPLRPSPRDDVLTIVSVGRLTESKGLIYLIEACRILRVRGINLHCQIVGQGEDEALLQETIERYGLQSNIKLLGALPHGEIPPLLEKATLFVLPCIIGENGDRDGMPLVLIEAMARGVPVVSSNLIGLPELVKNGSGLLVPSRYPAAIADACERIAKLSYEQREEMGRQGRRIIEDFDAAKGTTRLLELIHTVQYGHPIQSPEVDKKNAHHVTTTV